MMNKNKKQIRIKLKTLIKIVLFIILLALICCVVFLQNNNQNKEKTMVVHKEERTEHERLYFNDKTNPEFMDKAKDDTAKPIIYIYPEQETIVNAKLGNPENLTCTYPKYDEDEGWKVKANPNGDLQEIETGRNLYALYWEGIGTKVYDYSNPKEGFIVEGENTAEFLEEKLEILGLNDREKEEFIVYWLPQMEKNKYNYIRFETKDEIEEEMPLEIEPKPDTVIRVLMDWKALDEKIEIKEQKLESVQRNGYTVVEWGGSIINKNIVK